MLEASPCALCVSLAPITLPPQHSLTAPSPPPPPLPPPQAGLGRHRALSRVQQQLLGDLLALLTGLRPLLMLDYAPGATPGQLQQALAPLQTMLPGWTGAGGDWLAAPGAGKEGKACQVLDSILYFGL